MTSQFGERLDPIVLLSMLLDDDEKAVSAAGYCQDEYGQPAAVVEVYVLGSVQEEPLLVDEIVIPADTALDYARARLAALKAKQPKRSSTKDRQERQYQLHFARGLARVAREARRKAA